jgi:8-oxo-dGTP pyrophosphatase MutT (NUDIX family)
MSTSRSHPDIEAIDAVAGIDYPGTGVGIIIWQKRPNHPAEFLLVLRGPGARNERDLWDLVGGSRKLRGATAGAVTIPGTAHAESKEEVGVKLTNLQELGYYEHYIEPVGDEPGQDWINHVFLAELAPDSPEPCIPPEEAEKCADWGWFELNDFPPNVTNTLVLSMALLRPHHPDLLGL